MNAIQHLLYDYLISLGMDENWAKYLNLMTLLIVGMLIVLLVDFIIRRILRNITSKLAKRSKTNFDDILIKNKTPRNLAHIIPVFLAYEFAPTIFHDFPSAENIAIKGIQVFGIVVILWIMRSFLHTLKDYFKSLPNFKDKPIDSYIQVFMIFAWTLGLISIFAVITGISFLKFITTIGAASAIIILVFRDTIMGFVASIQVSINDMVRIGDWISFDKYGADGEVTEINLATVKVQNWDMTITTIPTYALISDSFKNWRGMEEAGGRRIKRSLSVKINSVKHLNASDIEQLKQIELISAYLTTRQNDIDTYNQENEVNKELLINGRNLTNLGIFRKYIESFIETHSAINKDMTIMVRQLEPKAVGIPIEIYAFSSDKRWKNYEYIMADIFDHIIASVHYFDLELFEYPNDSNFKTTN